MKGWLLFICFSILVGKLEVVGQGPHFEQAEWFQHLKKEIIVGTLEVRPFFEGENDRFWYPFRSGNTTRYYRVEPRLGIQTEVTDSAEIVELKRPKGRLTVRRGGKVLFGKYSPDSMYVAYVRKHDLYIRRVIDSVEFRLTTDGEQHYSYAQNGSDTSAEMVNTRAEWFGDSKKLYVIREDLRQVGEMPLISYFGKRPAVHTYRQAMAGDMNVPQYEASVFDVRLCRQVKVKMEKWPDQLLWLAYAGEKSDELFIQRKKRTRDILEICAVNTETGEVRIVIHEENKPYLNDELWSASFLPATREILWWSERSGYGHYYLYGYDGILKRRLTSGDWTSGRKVRIDTAGRMLYFEGHGQVSGRNPYYARLNSVHLDGRSGVKILTPEEGNHKVTFLPGGRFFVDSWSRPDMVPQNVVRNIRGRIVCRLKQAELSPLLAEGWRMPECFTVKAADSVTNLYGVMWKPVDFDSTRRYPVIAYVYPGPYTEYIPLDFELSSASGGMELAQLGFVVVCFGNRGGSPLRGRSYHTFGYGNLRDYPLADNKYGLEQIIRRYPYIDGTKVGIYGHSGGGAMAAAAICTYPDFYTAAVASAGNYDNTIFEYGWSEIHHGVKEVVKDGQTAFEFSIPTNPQLAPLLKGHLMLVAGTSDNIVNPANTLRMANALINAGKDFELVLLPGQKHGYMGVMKQFYTRKLWGHFARYLLKTE